MNPSIHAIHSWRQVFDLLPLLLLLAQAPRANRHPSQHRQTNPAMRSAILSCLALAVTAKELTKEWGWGLVVIGWTRPFT